MKEYLSLIFISIALILSLVVKKYDNLVSILLSLAAAALVLIECFTEFNGVIVKLNDFTDSNELFIIPLKALSITVISQIITALCEESGEKLLSFTVSTVSKVTITVITFPLIEDIIKVLNNIAER